MPHDGAGLAQVRNEMAKEQVKWDEERRQYEVQLEQRAAEIEALRNVAAGQGANTVVFGRDGSQSGKRADLGLQIKTLEEQVAAKDNEIQSLQPVGSGPDGRPGQAGIAAMRIRKQVQRAEGRSGAAYSRATVVNFD